MCVCVWMKWLNGFRHLLAYICISHDDVIRLFGDHWRFLFGDGVDIMV